MLRLILDRLLPARPKEDVVDIGVYTGKHIQQRDEILDALYCGKITPAEADNLMGATK